MLDTFLATLSPMMVMLFCLLIGFVIRRTKVEPENTGTVMSKMELYVFQPAQILYTFICNCTIGSVVSQYRIMLYSCVVLVLAFCIGAPLSRLFSKDSNEHKIYRYGLIFANYGFLGNAVVPQILGEAGLYLYMLFTLPMNVVMYGWAITSLIPEDKGHKRNILKNFLNPVFLSLVAGIVLGLLGARNWMPDVILTTLQNLSACMGPVAMLLSGFIIGGYHVPALLKNKRVYVLTFLRLLVLPTIMVGLLWLLGADRLTMILTLFAYASALGLNTVVIPAAYDGDTHTGASMAMVSHVCCIVTIPVLYSLIIHII